MRRWIRLAHKVSLYGKHPISKIGAILLKGKPIAFAANYSRPYGTENRGFHAEERVLKNCDAEGATIVVVRSSINGSLATMSRPCTRCWELLKNKGVKKVIYINWEGEIVIERV